MSPEFDFFVLYDGLPTEAHLWTNPFHQDKNDIFWNIEIYPKGQNLQILKLKKQSNGEFVEIFRDPKLIVDIDIIIKIINNHG